MQVLPTIFVDVPGFSPLMLRAHQLGLSDLVWVVPLRVRMKEALMTLKTKTLPRAKCRRVEMSFFLTRDRSSTKCPLRVHIAGHGSVTGPALGMGLV